MMPCYAISKAKSEEEIDLLPGPLGVLAFRNQPPFCEEPGHMKRVPVSVSAIATARLLANKL